MNKIFKAKIIFTVLFFMFSIFNCAIAQEGSWSQKTNFGGSARARSLSFSIGTKGYIGSGENGTETIDFWEYDQQSDTWTQKANLGNTGRYSGVGFSIGNKGYAGLGITFGQAKSDFWEYNPQNNTWTQKAFYPGTGKVSAVGFSIGAFGYIGTGSPSGQIGNETKQFWQYNPVNNSWTRKADFAGLQRDRAVGFSIASKGYIGTGYQFDGVSPSSLGDFWEYNPATDSWIQKASFQELARANAVGFSTGSRGYIGMGYSNKTDFWQYNPDIDSWLQVATFSGEGRLFPSAFSIGNKGYVGMGYSVGTQGTIYYNDFWEYEEQTLGMDQHHLQNIFEVYPNPASDFINLSSNEDIIETIVYNMQGKQQLKTAYTSIDISSLALGIYYLKIKTSKGVFMKKFIKN
jgi:N-acetylneuraminic acid mutarotase